MKKFLTLFAAVLMAGSMMAEHPNLISFKEPAAAGSLNGQTFGAEFTLTITDTGNKVSVDANNATFGVSDEGNISFNHRLKTGGKSSSANKMTLVVPEEGMLVVYARPASSSATDRYFVIANGSDTIMKHICLDTDTVEGASSKIFLPAIKENVPAGTYEVTYNAAINFYGFDMPALEEETTFEAVTLWEGEITSPMWSEVTDAQDDVIAAVQNGTIGVGSTIILYGYRMVGFEEWDECTIAVVENHWISLVDGTSGESRTTLSFTDQEKWAAKELDQVSFVVTEETLPLFTRFIISGIGFTLTKIAATAATTPTAVENTAAEVKAVKIIENGQVVILRDGKRYNAVGAEL